MIYSKEDQELIQKAISFLVENFNKSGNNNKPVILHSIRLAMRLYDKGKKVEVIGEREVEMIKDYLLHVLKFGTSEEQIKILSGVKRCSC